MITTSLELSKRLKEAGFPEGEPNFYWVCTYKNASHTKKEWKCIYDGHCNDAMTNNAGYSDPPLKYYVSSIEGGNEYSDDRDIIEKYPAYTAEEILEKLPKNITEDGADYCLEIYFCAKDQNCVMYAPAPGNKRGQSLADYASETLVDALALMYLHLWQEKDYRINCIPLPNS